MTVPTERSIPAVRMMSVWPIASTPTTITCWSTSERLGPWRKRSLFNEKNAIVNSSARNGPTAGAARKRRIHSSGDRTLGGWAEVCVALNVDLLPEEPILGRQNQPRPESDELPSGRLVLVGPTFLAPAVCEAVPDGLRSDADERLLRD